MNALDPRHGATQRAQGVSTAGHEVSGVSGRGVTLAAIGLLAGMALAMLAVWLLEPRLAGGREAARESGAPGAIARGWIEPAAELEAVRARAAERLSAVEWVDREAGVARIDIESAMRLLAERGWAAPDESDAEPGPEREPPAPGDPAEERP